MGKGKGWGLRGYRGAKRVRGCVGVFLLYHNLSRLMGYQEVRGEWGEGRKQITNLDRQKR